MFSEIFPTILYLILATNLIGIGLLSALRIYFIQRPSHTNYNNLKSNEPYVSIHLAICNEPVEIVLETIKSFENLNYKNFEVVIISNNTSDKSSWLPIESYCNVISNFNFFHYNNVHGYKAGALNIALTKMDKKTNYIFTVDSDYKLERNAINIAVGTLINREVDILQFPQDYRNVCRNTSGLQANYQHYFQCYLSAMDSEKFGLPTGTLTLINTRVFKGGLRWPIDTITEDAHFGVEALSKNFKIGYCDVSIGKGTMPANIIDYSKQFKRWIFGNFQTLILSNKNTKIKFTNKLRLFTMLTAWINLLAIPIVSCFITIPLIFLGNANVEEVYVLIIISLIVHLTTQLYILKVTSKNELRKTINAMLVHIGTIEIGSFYWILYFFNTKKPFQRTNKFIVEDGLSLRFFLGPLLLVLSSIFCLLYDAQLIGLVLMFIAIIGILGKLQLVKELYYSKFNLLKILRS